MTMKRINKILITFKITVTFFNNRKVLDFFEKNEKNIEFVNTFDFENLFGSIPHNLILDVFGNTYDEFSYFLK